MDQQPAGGKAQQQVFGATLDAEQGLACQQLVEMVRNGVAQAWLADARAIAALALELGGDAPAGCFNFGQFGHVRGLEAGLLGFGKAPNIGEPYCSGAIQQRDLRSHAFRNAGRRDLVRFC